MGLDSVATTSASDRMNASWVEHLIAERAERNTIKDIDAEAQLRGDMEIRWGEMQIEDL